jgi:hypothetical protein
MKVHMAAKGQTVIFVSPFKFGFFAGLGFFVASVVMSVLSCVLIALLGLGSLAAMIGVLGGGSHQTQHGPDRPVTPAIAVIANQ